MTSEHDRLLAEGPRTAPEPRTAPDLDGASPPEAAPFFADPEPVEAAAASPATASDAQPAFPVRPASQPAGSRRRSRPTYLRLLIPAVAIALAVGRSALNGHGGAAPVFGVISVLVLLGLIGLRGRRW
ncbi:MAG TPA: hypothetical protein VH063_05830 [Gaiellaceae bacterium]|jgi:hypothetical protein|nr:hypothetical protein [Gaiellaceae bacterium]